MADPPLNDRRGRRRRDKPAGERVGRGRPNERVSDAVDRANERVAEAVDRANERVSGAVDRANERVADAKARARELRARTKARLFGLDRSGPPPAPTQAGQPLNPWTLPNAIGYVRLALIPVFLAVAFSSPHGRATAAVLLFAVIGWTDYLDGFVARLTGQFSRLGALLDPIVDRCLVISGMAVAWRFALLPRVALAIVIAREVFMLALSRFALHHKVDIKINWFGRLAVAPILGAPFFAMAGVHTVAVVLLLVGMALSLTATGAYVRVGLEHRRRTRLAGPSS